MVGSPARLIVTIQRRRLPRTENSPVFVDDPGRDRTCSPACYGPLFFRRHSP